MSNKTRMRMMKRTARYFFPRGVNNSVNEKVYSGDGRGKNDPEQFLLIVVLCIGVQSEMFHPTHIREDQDF